jgi:CRP-like cAMP-binding protein
MNEAAYKAKLTDYIAARINITDQDKNLIANAYSLIEVKKKKHLFQQDQVCQIEGFVVKGTFRVYYLDAKGSEHVLYFAFPEWWVGDMVSFAGGDVSGLSVQALEDSLILVIDPVKKEELYKQVPALERLFRIIVQKHLAVLQKRFLLTVSASAAERYKELIQRSPGIEQLVPQHQIASYLGIFPESLSRMKKQLLK